MKLATLALGVVACGLAVAARRLVTETAAEPQPAAVSPAKRDARVLEEVARVGATSMVRADRAREIDLDVPEEAEIEEPKRSDREERMALLQESLESGLGAIQGQVRDAKTSEALAGVTIVAVSKDGDTHAVITDEDGSYELIDLHPDEYVMTFYYLENVLERSGVTVTGGKTRPVFQKLPVENRRYDGLGISFSGTTSLENVYIVEEPDRDPALDPDAPSHPPGLEIEP
jgi:hypothetical protein